MVFTVRAGGAGGEKEHESGDENGRWHFLRRDRGKGGMDWWWRPERARFLVIYVPRCMVPVVGNSLFVQPSYRESRWSLAMNGCESQATVLLLPFPSFLVLSNLKIRLFFQQLHGQFKTICSSDNLILDRSFSMYFSKLKLPSRSIMWKALSVYLHITQQMISTLFLIYFSSWVCGKTSA